jgi:tRNA dimethylallyltransferase
VAVALVGPTASGKSDIARRVARARRGVVELVSVDSMAVYRGMDIGTAKPSAAERAELRYHLVDLVDPEEEYTVTLFQTAARAALDEIADRDGKALLVGGTGLYLRAVTDDLSFPARFPSVAEGLKAELDACGPEGTVAQLEGCTAMHARLARLDPVAAGRIEPGNMRRVVRALEVTLGSGRPFSSFGPGLERYPASRVQLVGIQREPGDLDRRIAERFFQLMDQGFLEEVRGLASRSGSLSRTARQALGYRELLSHLENGVPLTEAVDEAVRRTRAFAKRQRAWFRRDPRIEWLDPGVDPVEFVSQRLDHDTGNSDGCETTRPDR